jgi:hypothetical protein
MNVLGAAITSTLLTLLVVAWPGGSSQRSDVVQGISGVAPVVALNAGEDRYNVRFAAAPEVAPLVVDLHQWSADHRGSFGNDFDLDLAVTVMGWNYLRPNLGSNRTEAGCCSAQAMERLTVAIDHALSSGMVDREQIFIVGASGGGYAGLCALMNGQPHIAAYNLWVPISDLEAWHSQQRHSSYGRDIRACTASGDSLDVAEARRRSPLYMSVPAELPPTRIYTGIMDGWNGSVPITHSIRMFNRLADVTGHAEMVLNDREILTLLEDRGTAPNPQLPPAGADGLPVHLTRTAGNLELIVFEGAHQGNSATVLRDLMALHANYLDARPSGTGD